MGAFTATIDADGHVFEDLHAIIRKLPEPYRSLRSRLVSAISAATIAIFMTWEIVRF